MAFIPELSKHPIVLKAKNDNVFFEIVEKPKTLLSTASSDPTNLEDVFCVVFSVWADVKDIKEWDIIIPNKSFMFPVYTKKEKAKIWDKDINLYIAAIRESNILWIYLP
jgi:hypothetical protein